MAGGEVEVLGEEQLLLQFVRLGGLTDEEILPALMAGGKLLVEEVKRQIDRRGLVDKGELKGSVVVEIVRKEVRVGTNLGFRGWIHEKGGIISKKRAAKLKFFAGGWKVKDRVSIPARPFMRPAVDNTATEVGVEINDRLRVIVRRKIGV